MEVKRLACNHTASKWPISRKIRILMRLSIILEPDPFLGLRFRKTQKPREGKSLA